MEGNDDRTETAWRFDQLLGKLVLVAIVVVFYLNLVPVLSKHLPSCAFSSITGFKCPGCGSTRAIHQLLQGNVESAWNFNPMAVIFFPLFILLVLWPGKRNELNSKTEIIIPAGFGWMVLALFSLYFFWRNI